MQMLGVDGGAGSGVGVGTEGSEMVQSGKSVVTSGKLTVGWVLCSQETDPAGGAALGAGRSASTSRERSTSRGVNHPLLIPESGRGAGVEAALPAPRPPTGP